MSASTFQDAMQPIPWNGSDIGDITHIVIREQVFEKRILLTFFNGEKAHITGKTDSISLIIDELKPVFGLDKVGRCLCTYRGQKGMLHRCNSREYSLENVDFSIPVKEIQKVFMFRWFLGLTGNFQRCILIKKYKSGITRVTSYLDSKYDFMKETPRGSDIPKTVMKKWFFDCYIDVGRHMLEGKTFYGLRKQIEAVITRIDPNHSFWIISIMSRIGVCIKEDPEECTSIPSGIVSTPSIPTSLVSMSHHGYIPGTVNLGERLFPFMIEIPIPGEKYNPGFVKTCLPEPHASEPCPAGSEGLVPVAKF